MQRMNSTGQPTRQSPHFTLLLIAFVGLSGCFPPKPRGQNDPPDPNCGIFYSCGNHGGTDDNEPPEPDSDSDSDTSEGNAPPPDGV